MADNYLDALKDELGSVENDLANAEKEAKGFIERRLDDIKAEIARVTGDTPKVEAEVAKVEADAEVDANKVETAGASVPDLETPEKPAV